MKMSKKQAEATRVVRGLVDGLAKAGYGARPGPRRDCKVTITVEIHLDVRGDADLDEVLTNVERNTEYALETAYDGLPDAKLTQSAYVTADLIVKKTEAAKAAKKKGKKK